MDKLPTSLNTSKLELPLTKYCNPCIFFSLFHLDSSPLRIPKQKVLVVVRIFSRGTFGQTFQKRLRLTTVLVTVEIPQEGNRSQRSKKTRNGEDPNRPKIS